MYALIGGSPPDGYTCPAEMGACNNVGDIIQILPVPIVDDPVPDDPPIGDGSENLAARIALETNSAIYTYDSTSGTLHFSGGKAQQGLGFFPSLNFEQLALHYPSIAEELSALKNMQSLASFKAIIPALPVRVVARPVA